MRSFEDDPTLADLLSTERQEHLLQLLEGVCGRSLRLETAPLADAEAVEFNLETLGWLSCPENPRVQDAAARLLEFVLFYVGKYRLAANLHHDSTEASFAELQRQHAALQDSELRYKALSEQLQKRVEDQVELINNAQQQLYETARLRAIGQLAAGVAHEINNPIGFIASNLRVASDYLNEMEQQLPTDQNTRFLIDDFRALVEESASGARRIAAIVADLKIFSNIDQADFVPCDLNALLSSTCHLLQAEDNQALDIQLKLGALPRLAGYPAKLSQAFYNVLDNAVKSIGDNGKIVVSTGQDSNGALEVNIHDNGCGICDSDLPRVFDPFFTTRPVGSGTGLGLTVARDVMVAHQGEILVNSRQDAGTRVTLRFVGR